MLIHKIRHVLDHLIRANMPNIRCHNYFFGAFRSNKQISYELLRACEGYKFVGTAGQDEDLLAKKRIRLV
jgi:hypothetical protein